jgi:[acyl-carrier-protein] S-malonyltransferase
MKYQRIALVFPGQGSQYAGMGKELYDQYKVVRDVFEEAGNVLGYDIAEKCFKKRGLGKKIIQKSDLDRTIYTQPAMFVVGYAFFKLLEEACQGEDFEINPSFFAGHSLGEYTALAAAGAMDFRTCMGLVQKRAKFITEFGDHYPDAGLMALVDRDGELEQERVESLCKQFQVYVTLLNTKKQVVVGGFKKNLTDLSKHLKKERILATLLKVEGPFHTPLMKPAADRFNQELAEEKIFVATKPIIANVSRDAIVDPDHIRKELYEQIFTRVDWRGSVRKMVENGADLFIEVGPKKVLTNMIRDIDTSVRMLNVGDEESLQQTVEELSGQDLDTPEGP